MENQILGISAGIWFFPIIFFLISLGWAYFNGKITSFFGKPPRFSRESFFLIAQTLIALLLMGIFLDKITTILGINDTAAVTQTAAMLAHAPFAAIIFLAFGALAEEMFFRGALYSELGKWPSIILFALAHGGYFSIVEIIGAFLAAIILTRAREQGKGIFPGFVAHALYNLAAVFILSAFV